MSEMEEKTAREADLLVAALETPVPSLEAVLSGLRHETWRIRRAAATAAARLEEADKAVQAFLAIASQGTPDLRGAVADALVEMGAGALPELSRTLTEGSHDMPIRRLVIEVLGTIGSAQGLSALETALNDEDSNVRMSAAEALGQVGGQEAAEALLRRLGKDDFMVTSAVAEALWNLGTHVRFEQAAPLLKDRRLVRPALKLLGLTRDTRAIDPLLEALASRVRPKRGASVLALGRFLDRADRTVVEEFRSQAEGRRQEVVDTLSWALGTEDESTQWAALSILDRLLWMELLPNVLSLSLQAGSTELALATVASMLIEGGLPEGLEPHALDPEELSGLYLAAAEAAKETNEPQRFQRLVEPARTDIRSANRETARAAAALLAEIGDPEDFAPMLAMAGQIRDDSLGLDEVCASLGRLGRRYPESAVEQLGELEDSTLARVLPQVAAHMHGAQLEELVARLVSASAKPIKMAGLRALGHLPRSQLTEELVGRHLDDGDEEIRALAARALPRNPSKELLEKTSALLQDRRTRVRRAACFGLGRSNRLDASDALKNVLEQGDSPDVETEAINALVRLGARIERRLLAPLFLHPDLSLAKAALEASRTGEPDPSLAGIAAELIGRERWDLRAEALRTLAYHGERKNVETLLHRTLREERDETVLAVARDLLAGM